MTPNTTSANPLLDDALALIEARLAALGAALRDRNAIAIESDALALQRALASAIHRFSAAARQAGGIPLPLRRRLAVISGQVQTQRESLVRATAALDRAMDVLMPSAQPVAAYAAHGGVERPVSQGGFVGA